MGIQTVFFRVSEVPLYALILGFKIWSAVVQFEIPFFSNYASYVFVVNDTILT